MLTHNYPLLVQLERLVEKNYYLHRSAKDAYRSYLLAYASHSHKHIFDVHALDLQKVAKALGLTVPPKVDLSTCYQLCISYFLRTFKLKPHHLHTHRCQCPWC